MLDYGENKSVALFSEREAAIKILVEAQVLLEKVNVALYSGFAPLAKFICWVNLADVKK